MLLPAKVLLGKIIGLRKMLGFSMDLAMWLKVVVSFN
jgi:hypothetical protein